MKMETRVEGDVAVVEFHGKIMGGPDAEKFREVVDELAAAGHRNAVLNMQQAPWMNSTGAGWIISGYVRYARQGGAMKACCLSPRMSMVFDLVFRRVIETFDSEKEALAAFRREAEA